MLGGGLRFARTLEKAVKPRMHFLQRWPGMMNLIGLRIASGELLLLLPNPCGGLFQMSHTIISRMTSQLNSTKRWHALGNLIFLSRWLQAPLYFGLIVAQSVYVYHFLIELWHLIQETTTITETDIMLTVLGLIDVVMIANLLVMVIVGGYETFVSRLNLQNHPDQPEWLSHVNAGVLKVKLATALIGISSIHLLKSFIEADRLPEKVIFWQVTIHLAFVLSALLLAVTDRLTTSSSTSHRRRTAATGDGVSARLGAGDNSAAGPRAEKDASL